MQAAAVTTAAAPRKRASRAAPQAAPLAADAEDPYLDGPCHPARQVERAAEALLQQTGGAERLRGLFLGRRLGELLEELRGGRLIPQHAYARLLDGVAQGLDLDPSVFARAALAQDDALWPARGANAVYVESHCDLREQSLSRRGTPEVRRSLAVMATAHRLIMRIMLRCRYTPSSHRVLTNLLLC
jgi:hypothetical protein